LTGADQNFNWFQTQNLARFVLQRRLQDWGLGLLVFVVCAVILFPVYWMILTSVQSTNDLLAYPPHFIPLTVDLSSYSRVVA